MWEVMEEPVQLEALLHDISVVIVTVFVYVHVYMYMYVNEGPIALFPGIEFLCSTHLHMYCPLSITPLSSSLSSG